MKDEGKDQAPVLEPTNLIGMPQAEGLKKLAEFGYSMRVTKANDKPCLVTRDFRPDRINVAVKDGIITEIIGMG